MLDKYNDLKQQVKEKLLKKAAEGYIKFNEANQRQYLANEANSLIINLARRSKLSITTEEHKLILEDIIADILGLGFIERLVADKTITEIMINRYDEIYVERGGKIEKTEFKFSDEKQLLLFVDRMLSPLGRRINETEPYVDARLEDGSRVNIALGLVALKGACVTIHKFNPSIVNMGTLLTLHCLNKNMLDFLSFAVKARLNILVTGGTSAGKTTTLNALSDFTDSAERIITIEDTAELQIKDRHVVSFESKPANIEGKGEVTIRKLLVNALHMRPDRIIIGEVRGDEALDLLQAMNTGHDGSMATLHANSPLDSLTRLELLCMLAGTNITLEAAKRQIISSIDLIVHMKRFNDGVRRIVSICELVKTELDNYKVRDIFVYNETLASSGKLNGDFQYSGHKPNCLERLSKIHGFNEGMLS